LHVVGWHERYGVFDTLRMQTPPIDSLGKLRRALDDDLFRIRPGIFWVDFGGATAFAWIAFWLTLPRFSPGLPERILWFALSSLGFYRALIFIHELAHTRSEKLRTFRLVWNIFCGSMFFLPEFTYSIHRSHHLTATFSTSDDPEYLPLAYQKPLELVAPFLILAFGPLAMMLRFLVAAPLSWAIGGRFREWLLSYASSFKMNPKFKWKDISAEDRRLAVVQEIGCLLWWSSFITFAFLIREPRIILHWYIVTYVILTVNLVRAIAAHGYANGEGERVTHEEQLLDSITITGFSPMALVLAPVGMRYHSLHHLFPTLPYYSMRKAHNRLLSVLPHDHIYRKTLTPSIGAALLAFLKTLRANQT
jgi:fatty acid desaturase